MEDKCFFLIDITGLDKGALQFLQSDLCHDHCEVVMQWIQRLVVQADNSKVIKVAPPILSRVYNQLGNGIVNLNNARKITEFPIPFPLAQMITVMLLVQWAMIPLLCATTIKTWYWAGMISFIVVFCFWSINYIATELEMPFGDDPNDLPLHSMQTDLNASLTTLMQETASTCPEFLFDPKIHLGMSQVKVDPAVLEPEDGDTNHIPMPSTSHGHSGLHWLHPDGKVKNNRSKFRKSGPSNGKGKWCSCNLCCHRNAGKKKKREKRVSS
jgi:hypothetical protein